MVIWEKYASNIRDSEAEDKTILFLLAEVKRYSFNSSEKRQLPHNKRYVSCTIFGNFSSFLEKVSRNLCEQPVRD